MFLLIYIHIYICIHIQIHIYIYLQYKNPTITHWACMNLFACSASLHHSTFIIFHHDSLLCLLFRCLSLYPFALRDGPAERRYPLVTVTRRTENPQGNPYGKQYFAFDVPSSGKGLYHVFQLPGMETKYALERAFL